jgi:hypothetical protein
MFCAETPQNIKRNRFLKNQIKFKTRQLGKVFIIGLDELNQDVMPEGQVTFCFSSSQRKAKRKNLSANFAPLR